MNQGIEMPDFHTPPGIMTDLSEVSEHLAGLPTDVAGLCEIVQNWFLHVFWLQARGYTRADRQVADRNIREAEAIVRSLVERNPDLLAAPREPEHRVVTCCRSYSVMLTALLIHADIPARSRCGFAEYFWPPEENRWEDHWVTEYWDADREGWRLVDAQLDALKRQYLRIDFDPLDVPRDQFLPAAHVWQLCRSGDTEPSDFAYEDFVGFPLIRWNLIRDVAALNKVEALGWDHWGGMFPLDSLTLTDEEIAFYDHVSQLASDDGSLPELRQLYQQDLRLRVPRIVQLMDAEDEAHALAYSDFLAGRTERLAHL